MGKVGAAIPSLDEWDGRLKNSIISGMASSSLSSDTGSSSSGSTLCCWWYAFSCLFIMLPFSTARTSCWKSAILRFLGRGTDGGSPCGSKESEGRGRVCKELGPATLSISVSLLLPFLVVGCSTGDIDGKFRKMSETKIFESICAMVAWDKR